MPLKVPIIVRIYLKEEFANFYQGDYGDSSRREKGKVTGFREPPNPTPSNDEKRARQRGPVHYVYQGLEKMGMKIGKLPL